MFTVPQNAQIHLAVEHLPVEEEWWIDFQCDFHQGVMDLGATYLVPRLLSNDPSVEVMFGLDFLGYMYKLVDIRFTWHNPRRTVGVIDDEVLESCRLPYPQLVPRRVRCL